MFLSTNINACLADNAKPNGKNKKEGEKGKYFGLLFLILGNAWLLCPSSGFLTSCHLYCCYVSFCVTQGKKHLGSKRKRQRQCHLFIARGGKTLFSSRCNCNVGLYFSSFKSCQKKCVSPSTRISFSFLCRRSSIYGKETHRKKVWESENGR